MNKMKKEKHKQIPLELKKLPYDGNSQDVKLLSGMPIIARVNNEKLNICNNDLFKITAIRHSKEIIEIINEEEENIDISFSDFQKLFYVAFCITTHKSQGSTFNEPYTIHDWEKMDETLRYVALSRSTNLNNINII